MSGANKDSTWEAVLKYCEKNRRQIQSKMNTYVMQREDTRRCDQKRNYTTEETHPKSRQK